MVRHHLTAKSSRVCYTGLHIDAAADHLPGGIPALSSTAPHGTLRFAVVWRRAHGVDHLHVVLPGAAGGRICLCPLARIAAQRAPAELTAHCVAGIVAAVPSAR